MMLIYIFHPLSPALTSMFGILAQHDELLVSKELVLDLCKYISDHVAEVGMESSF